MNRIAALPRRDWTSYADELVAPMTAALKTPNGTQTLFPIQATALYEIAQTGGGFISARVGAGKTAVAGLAPEVLGAKRPLLMIPADGKMVEKTEREFSALRLHWKIPREIRIMTYQFLGNPTNSDALDLYKPDLIVADEAQCLKRVKVAACAKRMAKYLSSNPTCRYAGLSGTFTGSGNILDYCHHVVWALREGAPVPLKPSEQERWARVLNPRVDPRPVDWRTIQESLGRVHSYYQAQDAFADRFCSTPGVIVSVDSFDWPLEIKCHLGEPPESTREAFDKLRQWWRAPDDFPLDDGCRVYGVARQLALDFYYRTDPRPPEKYLAARKTWGNFVRIFVESGQFDSAGEVVLNLARLPRDVREAYDAWIEQKDAFVHTTVVEWLDDSALRWAEDWARSHGPAIVWVQETAFGEELARRIGTAYHGEQSRLQSEDGKRTVVCSFKANMKGFNMQYAYSRNLIMSPPASADWYEQAIGRTHRYGQKEPVSVDVWLGCCEHLTAINNAIDRAEEIERTMKQPMKLCQADISVPSKVPNPEHPAWTKSRAKGEDE